MDVLAGLALLGVLLAAACFVQLVLWTAYKVLVVTGVTRMDRLGLEAPVPRLGHDLVLVLIEDMARVARFEDIHVQAACLSGAFEAVHLSDVLLRRPSLEPGQAGLTRTPA